MGVALNEDGTLPEL